jgi:nitrate reductase NapE
MAGTMMDKDTATGSKSSELRGFLVLTVIMAPVVAVAVVFGYGFLIWMYQLVQGPPTY